jgi:hypothetical protein
LLWDTSRFEARNEGVIIDGQHQKPTIPTHNFFERAVGEVPGHIRFWLRENFARTS